MSTLTRILNGHPGSGREISDWLVLQAVTLALATGLFLLR